MWTLGGAVADVGPPAPPVMGIYKFIGQPDMNPEDKIVNHRRAFNATLRRGIGAACRPTETLPFT